MRTERWSVAPRFTPGSPAQVDEALAERVWQQERDAYPLALEGAYGPGAQRRAVELGLAWVVYLVYEQGGRLYREDRCEPHFVQEITTLARVRPGERFVLDGATYYVSTWGSGRRRRPGELVLATRAGTDADADRLLDPQTRVYRVAAERRPVQAAG